ncbi:MAG: GTP pyrophosphokinase family protein [Lachnospiraceae bacterium]
MELQMWRELLNPYELAVDEITAKFEHLIKEHRDRGFYSPIEQVDGRVKKISSILEKCQNKGVDLSEVTVKIEDIAGIRIICQFVEDIERVVEMIHLRNDMEVKTEKDYVTDVKESGYRSYHMIVWYTVDMMDGPKRIMVEIQIRTMAMNFWATIEHSLQYKYKMHMPPEINERLLRVADATVLLDREMSQVRLEIMDAQNAFQHQAKVVADILNIIQNMYKVAAAEEMEKIQQDFYRIYSLNNMQQLEEFLRQMNKKAESYHVQIMNK